MKALICCEFDDSPSMNVWLIDFSSFDEPDVRVYIYILEKTNRIRSTIKIKKHIGSGISMVPC